MIGMSVVAGYPAVIIVREMGKGGRGGREGGREGGNVRWLL